MQSSILWQIYFLIITQHFKKYILKKYIFINNLFLIFFYLEFIFLI